MKVDGQEIEPLKIHYVAIPRDKGDIIFKAEPVIDYIEFDELCPKPEPPEVLKPGNIRFKDPNNPEYKKRLDEWAERRSLWMILKSLEPSNITWDTVNMSDPSTWIKYQDEMDASGLSKLESSKILDMVINACGLNQDRIDEATERFLANLEQPLDGVSSPVSGLRSTPSGEPAKE